MEANLQSDFSVMDGFLQKLMEAIEAAHTQDARSRLAQDLMRYYKGSKGRLEFRTVPQKYAREVTDALARNNIAHMASVNSAGDTVIILPPDGESGYHYGTVIDEVFMHHPEYYKQLEKTTWTRLARADGERGVISVSFKNQLDAEIFKNKVFADGDGIVTTDKINEDGSVTIYCRESDLINSSHNKDAISAIIDTEYSLDEKKQAFARRLAVWHDGKQADDCMHMMRKGEAFIIHDGADKYGDYLKFENNVLTYGTFDNELKKSVERNIEVDLKNPDAMRKLFERYLSHIHNEYVSSIEEYNRDFNDHTESYIRDRYADKQKELYTEVILPAMGGMFTKREGMTEQEHFEEIINSDFFQNVIKQKGLEDIRPDFSVDFLNSLKDDLSMQEESLIEGLKELAQNAKAERKDFVEMLVGRTESLKHSFLESGIDKIGGKAISDMSIADLQKELMHKTNRQEAKLREACGVKMQGCMQADPKVLLRAMYTKGTPIAHMEEATPLMAKQELTKEEQARLQLIADDTIYNLVASANPAISPFVQDYYSSRSKLREVEDLINDCNKLKVALDNDTKANSELIEKQKNMLKSVRSQKEQMEKLIDSELTRTKDISRMDKVIHEHIKDYKFENPTASTTAILREVKDFLRKEGFSAPHAEVVYRKFNDFEQEIKGTEREETVERSENSHISFDR